MDHNTPEAVALHAVAKVMGGQAAIARALNYGDRRNVWPWFTLKRRIPPDHCPVLERETGRKGAPVHCEQLRPDVPWKRLPDPAWPWHPDGRPLIDLTRPVPVAVADQHQQETLDAA